MAPSKLQKAIGAVKDKTSISLAKVGTSNSISHLEVAILKATRHEEYPAEERHIREILCLTSYSRAYVGACVNAISKRLNKTKNWTVALKTLMLIQRILAEGDPGYEQEIFFSTRRGTRLLNMSDFRDTSHSNSWDYSAFVRAYALYLEERLEFRMQGRRGKRSVFGMDEEEEDGNCLNSIVKSTPVRDMKSEHIFSRIQHLQQLLERFLACKPTGSAKNNRVVIVALNPIVKESFHIYYDITEILGILIDRFMELEVPDSVKVYEIFCRVSKQYDELDVLYSWCKSVGIARSGEYPEVEKITPKKLELMDEFIRDKSALAQTKKSINIELDDKPEEEPKEHETAEEKMDSIKALPPPEAEAETASQAPAQETENEEPEEKEIKQGKNTTEQTDLLNLAEDLATTEEQADNLALALFDGVAPTGPAPTPAWEAFSEGTADWETALVQSASNLSYQKATFGGGFDMLLLDGMYQQGATNAAVASQGYGNNGSSSSVALGSTGRPAMLALPAPPTKQESVNGTTNWSADPFAASCAVEPPPYVQMSDLVKKQNLLVAEQQMWQQYARDGMQGQLGIAKLQHDPYNMGVGGYTRGY